MKGVTLVASVSRKADNYSKSNGGLVMRGEVEMTLRFQGIYDETDYSVLRPFNGEPVMQSKLPTSSVDNANTA